MRVKILGDRLAEIKLVLEEDIIQIISANASQAGQDESAKKQFWKMVDSIGEISIGEKIFLVGT